MAPAMPKVTVFAPSQGPAFLPCALRVMIWHPVSVTAFMHSCIHAFMHAFIVNDEESPFVIRSVLVLLSAEEKWFNDSRDMVVEVN